MSSTSLPSPTSDLTDTLDSLRRDSIVYAAMYGALFLFVVLRMIRDNVRTLVAYHALLLLALFRVGAFVAQYELVRHSSSDDWQHANRAASTARDVLNVFGIFFLVEAVSEFVVRWFAVLRSNSVTGLSQTRFVVYHLRHFILAGTLGIGVAGAVQHNDAIFTGNTADAQQGKALLLAAGGIWLAVAVLTLVGAIAIAALPAGEHEPKKFSTASMLSLYSGVAILAGAGAVCAPISATAWANTAAGVGVFIVLPDLTVLIGSFLWRVNSMGPFQSVFGVRHDEEVGRMPEAQAHPDKSEAELRATQRAIDLHDEVKSEQHAHETTPDDSASSAPSAPSAPVEDYGRKRFGLKAVLHRKSDKSVDAAGDADATIYHHNRWDGETYLPK